MVDVFHVVLLDLIRVDSTYLGVHSLCIPDAVYKRLIKP